MKFCLVIIILVYVSLALASVDDDETLHFYWDPPISGNVHHYKVRIYESVNNGESYNIKLEENTDSSGPYTKDNPYALSIKAEHGYTYKIEVAGYDSNGNLGHWSDSSEHVLCYLSSQPVNIDLKSPLSFISLPIQPYNANIKSVLDSIDGKYKSVWYYDGDNVGSWKLYFVDPVYPSDLKTIEAGKGYWIEVKDDCILRLKNWKILSQQEMLVDLFEGLNAVGYNSLQSQHIEKAFSSISGKYNFAYAYDDLSHKWQNAKDLGNMFPGKGYLVEANIDCIWDIGKYNQILAPSSNFNTKDDPFEMPSLPYNIWGTVEVNGKRMTSKDDCKIILKVKSEVKSDCRLKPSLYGDFYSLYVPVSKDFVEFDLYNQVGNSISKVGTFPVGEKGEIKRIDLSFNTEPKTNMLYQNYPNPFNPDTWIPYQLNENSNVIISIYNTAGQIVRILNLSNMQSGYYLENEKSAYWDGKNESGEYVTSGIYFYMIETSNYKAVRKMTMMK